MFRYLVLILALTVAPAKYSNVKIKKLACGPFWNVKCISNCSFEIHVNDYRPTSTVCHVWCGKNTTLTASVLNNVIQQEQNFVDDLIICYYWSSQLPDRFLEGKKVSELQLQYSLNLESIGENAFFGDMKTLHIHFGYKLKSLHPRAFAKLGNLSTLQITYAKYLDIQSLDFSENPKLSWLIIAQTATVFLPRPHFHRNMTFGKAHLYFISNFFLFSFATILTI